MESCESATGYMMESDSATPSEMVRELVEGQLEKRKEVAYGCALQPNIAKKFMNAGKVLVPQLGRRALIMGGSWVLACSWGGFYV